MKEYNRYVKKWQNLAIRMNEAMQKDDFTLADSLLEESAETYRKYKECCGYVDDNRGRSFGELNSILESRLLDLFKSNRKALKECTSMIKEDKNLRSAFKFVDALRRYDCGSDVASYVNESLLLASDGIDKKTFKESVKKLADLLSKYEIGGCSLDEATVEYYRNCDKVLTETKKLSNLTEYTNAVNSISGYISSRKERMEETAREMTEALEGRLANLTEEDRTLVQDIIDHKQPIVDTRKEQLFNRMKSECISMVDALMNEASDEEKNGLSVIREQIESKVFNNETIVQDIAKLLEIRDILSEK